MSKILFKIFDIAAFKVVEKVTHTCELQKPDNLWPAAAAVTKK